MKFSDYLIKKFEEQEVVFYDEAIIELKMIELEVKLKSCIINSEIVSLYEKLKRMNSELNRLKTRRFVEFIISEIYKKASPVD